MLLQCRGTDWLRGQMSSQQCGLRNEDKVLAHSLLLWSLLPNASVNIASDRGMQYHLSLPPHVCVFNNLEGVLCPFFSLNIRCLVQIPRICCHAEWSVRRQDSQPVFQFKKTFQKRECYCKTFYKQVHCNFPYLLV